MFISFDGGDGCGKSTQQKLLGQWLTEQGHDVVLCRDPGSTPLGDAVRNVLLHSTELNISDRTEVLLFCAARCQLVHDIIQPALAEGKTVVSDRFLLSTYTYQGYAGGVPLEELKKVGHFATYGVLPDLSLILDVPYEVGLKRLEKRVSLDRMEQKEEQYHQSVRNGFLKCAAKDPDRCVVIDATQPIEKVAAAIQEAVQRKV